MAQQVTVNGLRFIGPDKEILCPSWDFIVSQLSTYIGQLNTEITAINADIVDITDTVNGWPKQETQEVNNNG